MAEISKFGSARPSGSPDSAICAQWEGMLTDALDRTLSPDDQAIFDRHLTTCADCSRMFMDARRGSDWLGMLKAARPEPPAALLERILASTGPAADLPSLSAATQPNMLLDRPMLVPAAASDSPAVYAAVSNVIPFRQRISNVLHLRNTFMQPRLAMTAAMAFFSIALTLNLTGVHITQLRASDLKPSSLRRSFYDANAKVVRSIDNLRVVYELESRVQDLQRNDNDSTTSTPAPASTPASSTPSSGPAASPNQNSSPSGDQKQDDQKAPGQQKQAAPRPHSGSSRSVAPKQSLQFTASAPLHPETDRPGSPLPALRLEQASLLFTPNVFRYQQQGGQA